MMLNILLVDVRETIAQGLMQHDLLVRHGLKQPWNYHPDVIITSSNINLIRNRYKSAPIIVYSKQYIPDEVKHLFNLGIADYLQDPTFLQIVHAIRHCLYRDDSGTKQIEDGLATLSAFASQARGLTVVND